jgi:hypothetical protein
MEPLAGNPPPLARIARAAGAERGRPSHRMQQSVSVCILGAPWDPLHVNYFYWINVQYFYTYRVCLTVRYGNVTDGCVARYLMSRQLTKRRLACMRLKCLAVKNPGQIYPFGIFVSKPEHA